MKYNPGDLVKCPPSGPHPGPRIGKVIRMSASVCNPAHEPVLVKYIDYPEESCGWFYGYGAWVHPIGRIKFEEER